MSDETRIEIDIAQEIDITQAVGDVLVEGLQAMGLVLVPETLARAAYQVADLFEERIAAAGEGALLDEDLERAMDGLISQVAIARARKPGEQAT